MITDWMGSKSTIKIMTPRPGNGCVLWQRTWGCSLPDPATTTAQASLIMILDAIRPTQRSSTRCSGAWRIAEVVASAPGFVSSLVIVDGRIGPDTGTLFCDLVIENVRAGRSTSGGSDGFGIPRSRPARQLGIELLKLSSRCP